MTSIKLRDGDITLYHRRDSKNWQADIRLPDGGRHTLSLRTANEKLAKDKVILIYEDMYFRHKHGLTSVAGRAFRLLNMLDDVNREGLGMKWTFRCQPCGSPAASTAS